MKDGNKQTGECKAHKFRQLLQVEEGGKSHHDMICWVCGARASKTTTTDSEGNWVRIPDSLVLQVVTDEYVFEEHDYDKPEQAPTRHPLFGH